MEPRRPRDTRVDEPRAIGPGKGDAVTCCPALQQRAAPCAKQRREGAHEELDAILTVQHIGQDIRLDVVKRLAAGDVGKHLGVAASAGGRLAAVAALQ